MNPKYNIIGEILFSKSLNEIKEQLKLLRKDEFNSLDRIIIKQDVMDDYPYVDGVGSKLIEIQKIINNAGISNCFILFVTPNQDISNEIEFITKFYSVDSNAIEFQLINGSYEKSINQYPDTACQMVWNHLYVGTDGNVNPCCVADHRFPLINIKDISMDNQNHYSDQIRNDMLQGYRHRACSPCYEREDKGIPSLRLPYKPEKLKTGIQSLDIRLNNVCNFKCRMCSEYFSSAIQQETIDLYGKDSLLGFEKISLDRTSKKIRNQRLEKILPLITTDIQNIYFAGGEPLITEEHYHILDHLVNINNTDLQITYNTNLSMLSYKKSNSIDKWKQFSNVTVFASIDASDAVAEYVRHGTVWNDIIANIHTIKKHVPHVKLKVTSTVSCLTIENLIHLQNKWIGQELFSDNDFRITVLTDPNFLSPAVLPQHHKERLRAIIQKHIQRFANTELARQWQNVLQLMDNNDYTFALDDFTHRMKVLDEHRQESFVQIFPEFEDLYIK